MGTKSSVFFKKNWTQNWIFSNLFVWNWNQSQNHFSLFITNQNPKVLHRSIAKVVSETKDEILTSGNGSCVAKFWSEVLGLIFGMSDFKLEPETEVKSQEK
jgi:hypothetical protein